MAQLSGGTAVAIRMDQLNVNDLLEGDIISKSGTQLRVNLGDGYIDTFSGTGFTYNSNDVPTGGTITGVLETLNGSTVYNVAGLTTSAPQFFNFVVAGNTAGALNLLFTGDDDMQGTAFNDLIGSFAGHDNINGGAGSDTLEGGAGNDHLYGQSANGGTDGNDVIFGGDGSDYLQGNAGNDSLDGGNGSDRIQGGRDDDSIRGSAGNDTINGNLGNDGIDGGSDNDSLRGGQGNDTINGGDGNDVLSGDLGVDRLTGGSGIDIFVFGGSASIFAGASADIVTDFQDGTDRIQIGYSVEAVLTGAAQSDFSTASTVAQSLFNGRAGTGEVAAIKVGADTFLFYSSTNGSAADSAVQLIGIDPAAVTVSDFG